jgi:hypothetical protein
MRGRWGGVRGHQIVLWCIFNCGDEYGDRRRMGGDSIGGLWQDWGEGGMTG